MMPLANLSIGIEKNCKEIYIHNPINKELIPTGKSIISSFRKSNEYIFFTKKEMVIRSNKLYTNNPQQITFIPHGMETVRIKKAPTFFTISAFKERSLRPFIRALGLRTDNG